MPRNVESLFALLEQLGISATTIEHQPLRNDRTTSIRTSDFLSFLEALDHSPRIVQLPG